MCEYASEVKARMLKKSFVKRAARAVSLSHLYTYFCTTNIRKTFVGFIVRPIVFLVVALHCCNTFMKNGWHLVMVMRVASCEEKLLLAMLYTVHCTLYTLSSHFSFIMEYGMQAIPKHQTPNNHLQYKSIVGILQTP